MRGPILIASLVGAAMTSVIGAHGLARAQDAAPPPVEQAPAPVQQTPSAAPASEPQPQAQMPPAQTDPVVEAIRAKLSDAAIGKDANAADVAARTVYLVQIGYISMQADESAAERMARIARYVTIFTGRKPKQRELDRFFARHGFVPPA